MKDVEFIETKQVRAVRKLADLLISEGGIGEIVGDTGCGKTEAVAQITDGHSVAIRICGWDGITRRQLMGEIAHSLL